jgi:putative ABC transport system permease protein
VIRSNIRRWFHLALRRRDRWERDVEDEIKLHLALRAEQLMAEGADATTAYQEAVRRFGPLKESRSRLLEAAGHREQRMERTELLDNLRADIGFAMRTMARQKAWTTVTLTTLALGIGATTAVFSIVSTLLIHPLPYPNANRIVYVNQQPTGGNTTGIPVTISPVAKVVRAWMQQSHSFESFEGSQFGPRSLKTNGADPSVVMVESIFPTFASFVDQRPIFGRMFRQSDIDAGLPVVVLSEGFWRERLAAKRNVLGQALKLGDSSFTIVGVMPGSFHRGSVAGRPADMWIPLDARIDNLRMSVMGRLRPGVTTRAAAAELDSIFARSQGFEGDVPFSAVVNTPADRIHFRDSLMLLTAAVGLVLLVACANVAHLLLSRGSTRQREMAIRAALGAGRGRILRQLLVESALLSFAGTASGVFVGWAGLKSMIAVRPRSLDDLSAAHLDLTTLGVAIAVAVATGIVFALIGARQATRVSTHDALKTSSARIGGHGTGRTRGILVVSEMALSGALLVGATLLVRSVMKLQAVDLGFDARGLYALNVPLKSPQFESAIARTQAVGDFMRRLHALPAVRAASVADVGPGSRRFTIGQLEIEGEPPPPTVGSAFIDVNSVDRSYFATMGMTFKHGGVFTDTTPGSRQVIVNEGFARLHWQQPLGKRLRILQQRLSGQDEGSVTWLTIVGVVRDARTGGALSESNAPLLYTPLNQISQNPAILVRVEGGAQALAPAGAMIAQMGVRRAPPAESIAAMMSRAIAGPRFIMLLLAILTTLALALAAVGLYGVMSHAVSDQTRDIGIRVALGASSQRIATRVIGAGVVLALAGVVAGFGFAAWGTQLIQTQLHDVDRLDPISFAVGAVVLMGVALVACIVPTRRALAVDPMTAIRAE